jgi:hypothetical protein
MWRGVRVEEVIGGSRRGGSRRGGSRRGGRRKKRRE